MTRTARSGGFDADAYRLSISALVDAGRRGGRTRIPTIAVFARGPRRR